MRRSLSLVLFLLFSVLMTAQDQSRVDSLEKALEQLPPEDTMRLYTLVYLWDATIGSDLNRADAYTRQMIREGLERDDAKLTAAGYQRLGVTCDYAGKSDSAMFFYRKALAIYQARNSGRMQGIMLFNVAILQQEKGLYDSARHYLALADDRFKVSSRLVERSAVNTMKASIERQQGNPAEGIKSATIGYELALQAGDSSRMAAAEEEIAFNYMNMDQDSLAAKFFERSYRFHIRVHDEYYASLSLMNLATCHQAMNKFESALAYGNEALAIVQENQYEDLVVDVLKIIGNVYWSNEDYEQAEQIFLQAKASLADKDLGRVTTEILTYLSGVQLNLEKYDQSRSNGLKGLAMAEEQGQTKLIHRAYGQLAIVASKQGDFEQAYDYMVIRQGIQDSLYHKELGEEVARLTLLFENEKKERLISEQKNQLALLESQARAEKLQRTALIGGLIALLALLTAGWYSYRQRHQRQELEKARLADELKTHQKELSTHALQMAQKGQLLDQLREEIRQIKGERPDDRKKLDGMLRELGSEERIDQDWANFRSYFQGVHGDFEERLKAAAEQTLSPRELRLAALIKMQLNNQEVGAILSISQDSLYKAKYRLRKKLPQAGEGELDAFIREV
ncbi:tetratricopeptide repeat protein [Neolewinella persica]|uniref:tetratricopeptide repeat protein n=1 Tax=Neolewinella persica TaxID=70998 RepID=UPI00039D8284|nr:tetratricopeptide repeat protein [Neolewinella persica]